MGSRQGTRWLAWAAGASLVSGAISGCSDGGAELTATPTTTSTSAVPTTPAATPSPLVTAVPLPVMPPEMANNDAAGAEAAVRYFLALYGYSYLALDTEQLQAMSDTNCVFCSSALADIGALKERTHAQNGGRVFIESIVNTRFFPATNSYIVDVRSRQEPYMIVDSTGAVIDEDDGGEMDVSFIVAFEERWTVFEVGPSE